MIPKVIHYFWFGKASLPSITVKCINSWRKYLPDYEIKLWDETNFDVDMIPYTKEAYESKKWAFVSDYARFYILYYYGGIYLDTDVEIIKNIDIFLSNRMFAGFESKTSIAPGLILGSESGNILFKEILQTYEKESFYLPNGKLNMKTVVKRMTDILVYKGLKLDGGKQTVQEMTIYPVEYFCPIDRDTCRLRITPNTYSIHHYTGSWLSKGDKIKIYLTDLFIKIGFYEYIRKVKKIIIK